MPLILPNTIANQQFADGDKLQQNFGAVQSWANQEAISRDGSTAMTGPLLLPGVPTQPDQAATKAYVDATGLIGEVKTWPGDAEPAGFMFCRGQALSRATYAALWAVLGTKFGGGDGSTTFNLPALQGRSPMGMYPGGPWAATLGQMFGNWDSTLPVHSHTGVDHLHNDDHQHSGTTNAMDRANSHNHQGGTFPFLKTGFGDQIAINRGAPSFGYQQDNNTTDTDINHLHTFTTNYKSQQGFGASTGAADRNLNVGASGVSPTNTNIHPVVVFNFIIKVQ